MLELQRGLPCVTFTNRRIKDIAQAPAIPIALVFSTLRIRPERLIHTVLIVYFACLVAFTLLRLCNDGKPHAERCLLRVVTAKSIIAIH